MWTKEEMTELKVKAIEEQAQRELYEERFRAAVDKEKERLRNKKSIWDRVFPYKIIVIKKK